MSNQHDDDPETKPCRTECMECPRCGQRRSLSGTAAGFLSPELVICHSSLLNLLNLFNLLNLVCRDQVQARKTDMCHTSRPGGHSMVYTFAPHPPAPDGHLLSQLSSTVASCLPRGGVRLNLQTPQDTTQRCARYGTPADVEVM